MIDSVLDDLDRKKATVEALRLKREIVNGSLHGQAPLKAYRHGLMQIPLRFPAQHEQEQIELSMPPYKSMRTSLYYACSKKVLPINDVNNLPIEYELTQRRREAYVNDRRNPLANERFMLHNGDGMILYASDLDLSILHSSEFWIADGTFEMCPKEFAQVYTIHGFLNGECFPCFHALLPNRLRHTYDTMFDIIHTKLIHYHGNMGSLHTMLVDFEAAVHDSARAVLNVQTRGCNFHFGKCLIRRIQAEGLMKEYENKLLPIRKCIDLMRSLVLLPPDLVTFAWDNWLENPPPVADVLTQGKLQRFRDCFRETWVNGRWDIDLWNHFSNGWQVYQPLLHQPGPRTTNHAEGWHNRINHDFGTPHPSLNKFLSWLQEANHVNQIRIRQLQDEQFRDKEMLNMCALMTIFQTPREDSLEIEHWFQ